MLDGRKVSVLNSMQYLFNEGKQSAICTCVYVCIVKKEKAQFRPNKEKLEISLSSFFLFFFTIVWF